MWWFADGFDLYAAMPDAILNGYWDGALSPGGLLVHGRFTGSKGLQQLQNLQKTSGQNHAVHKFSVAFMSTIAPSGVTPGTCIALFDGATVQCTLYFRTDGGIFLARGAYNGTVIASWPGAFTNANTWYQFEIEVVIDNSAGSLRIRKLGNTVNDYDSGPTLDTQSGTNPWANKIIASNPQGVVVHVIDDFIWRSDSAVLPWLGDLRCHTRLPASDVQAQWTRSAPTFTQFTVSPGATTIANSFGANVARWMPLISNGGAISAVTIPLLKDTPGNIKCAIFASNASTPPGPGTVIQAATAPITNATQAGPNIFTFSPPVVIPTGTLFWVGICVDTAVSQNWACGTTDSNSNSYNFLSTGYAAFPYDNPTGGTNGNQNGSLFLTITPAANATYVADGRQDGANSYLADGTVGDEDMFHISPISVTPSAVFAVAVRGLMQKTDAGTRTASLVLKSGANISVGTPVALNTSWGWVWRTDFTDPATGTAWTAAGVNNAQIGMQLQA